MRPDQTRAQRYLPALLLLSFLTFFLGLGRQAISDTDEGFYAEAAREMVASGDWLTPHFNYADRWQKPILYYWVSAAAYVATGPSEASARTASALSAIGLVLLTWLAARRLAGDSEMGFLAGAIVATCYGYFFMARQALPDLPLAFFITLTVWAALDRRWLLTGVAAGLGFLTKGPVAFVIPAIVLAPIWWRERARPPLTDLLLAGVVALLVGLPWYLLMTAQHGVAYLQSFFLSDNLERFATTRFNGPRFVLYYLPIVIGGMLPWSVYLLVLPWRRAIAVARRQTQLTVTEWRLLAWALVPLVFYTISVGKQPRYVLPVLPPLAILLAQSISSRIRNTEGAAQRDLALASWLTALVFGGFAVLLFRARPLFLTAYPALTFLSIGALALAALAIAGVASTRDWQRLPTAMATASVIAMLAVQFGAFAGRRPEPVEQMAALIRANATTERVGEYQVFVRNLVFYTGRKQAELFNEPLAVDFLRSADRVLLVVRARDLERLETLSGRTTQRLGQVRYLDTANIKLRTLLWPLPDQDIDTVWLVANQ